MSSFSFFTVITTISNVTRVHLVSNYNSFQLYNEDLNKGAVHGGDEEKQNEDM